VSLSQGDVLLSCPGSPDLGVSSCQGRPIAGERTAAPMSNPPLRRQAACGRRPQGTRAVKSVLLLSRTSLTARCRLSDQVLLRGLDGATNYSICSMQSISHKTPEGCGRARRSQLGLRQPYPLAFLGD
jgi:hypothetical protein